MLIKTISEIKQHLKVNTTQTTNAFLPFISDAQDKYLRPVIGDALLDALEAYYNAPEDGETPGEGESTTEALQALLPYVQKPLARFIYFMAAPHLDLNVGETGFTVSQTQGLGIASSDRVKRYIDSLEKLGWDGIEILLRFLEKNASDYPEWTASDEYTLQLRNFINSAEEFDKYVNIDKSRLKFIRMRQLMDDIENTKIKDSISSALADEILAEIKAGNVSEANNVILPFIRRAIANYTMADFRDSIEQDTYLAEREKENLQRYKRFELMGDNYLAQVKKIMNENIDSYPDYAASDEYDSEKTGYTAVENEENTGTCALGV
jgi:hypothetical protein